MNCSYCNTQVTDTDAVVCPHCGVDLEIVPWEHPAAGNWLGRWWRTCLLGMRRPAALFRALRPDRSLGPAMTFFALCTLLQLVVAAMLTSATGGGLVRELLASEAGSRAADRLFSGDGIALLDRLPGRPRSAADHPPRRPLNLLIDLPETSPGFSAAAAAAGFVWAFLSLFALAGFFQLGALLFLPTRRSFADTLRVTAYAHAPVVCALVPFVGQIAFALWMSCLMVIGLAQVHRTTVGRIVLAMTVVPLGVLVLLAAGCLTLLAQIAPAVRF